MGTKCRFPDAVMAAENPAHCGLRLAKNPSKNQYRKFSEKGRKSWENVENNDAIYKQGVCVEFCLLWEFSPGIALLEKGYEHNNQWFSGSKYER